MFPISIIALAQNVMAEHETRDPFKVCAALGIAVQRHPLLDYRGYYMKVSGRDIITLADNLHGHTELFVCAHELGHQILHQRFNRPFMDYRTFMVPGRFENEADKFAVHFLFSTHPMCREEVIDSREMAEILNVPIGKVDTRMTELEIQY